MNLHVTSFLDGAAMPELVERAGWALIHSIWQFSIVAVVLLAAERLLAKSTAAARYLVSSIALCAMVCCVTATFCFLAPEPAGGESTALAGADRELAPRRAAVSHAAAAAAQEGRGLSELPGGAIASGAIASGAIASGAESQPRVSGAPEAPESRSSGPTNASAGAQRSGSHSARLAAMQIQLTRSIRPWLASCVALWAAGMAIAALRLIAGGFRVWRLRRAGTSQSTMKSFCSWLRPQSDWGCGER